MHQYLSLLDCILKKGVVKESGRLGMPNTKGVFGYQMRFDLGQGFPLLTTKKMPFKAIAHELIWFLRGETNIKYLVDSGVNIWNKDAYRHYKDKCKAGFIPMEEHDFIDAVKNGVASAIPGYNYGDLGEVYGAQWRRWQGLVHQASGGFDKSVVVIDQIAKVISQIKANPFGRRHIVTAWNPAEVDSMALPPCHLLFQFNCRPLTLTQRLFEYECRDGIQSIPNEEGQTHEFFDKAGIPKFCLDCALTQRSCDTFLGVPFNIASYALLTEIIAKMCNMVPGEFIWNGNDVHIYDNHLEAVAEQLKRSPMEMCIIKISDRVASFEDISQIAIEDIVLHNYESHPPIKGELSVGI